MLQAAKENADLLSFALAFVVAILSAAAWLMRHLSRNKTNQGASITQRSGNDSVNVVSNGDVRIGDR